ncbi:MAG TPA: hypothetical protein VLG74_07575 [Blastocatellia bacterium]|nr:hypothetical protein [Blastocatellia bacterium]
MIRIRAFKGAVPDIIDLAALRRRVFELSRIPARDQLAIAAGQAGVKSSEARLVQQWAVVIHELATRFPT